MSNKNVILKSSRKLILPDEIPAAEAIRRGLATPPRTVNGIRLPALPAGLGVFAKFAVHILNQNGTAALAKHDAKFNPQMAEELAEHDQRGSAELAKCDPKDAALRDQLVARHADLRAQIVARYANLRAGVIARYSVPFRSPKTGRMVKKLERPVHSFTRNFGQFIRGFLQNADGATLNLNETLVDDAGASFLCRLKSNTSGNNIAIVSALAKMKFGSSNAAVSTTQFNLQGVLLGPTTEASVVVALVVEDSTNTIFTCTGQITNGTGGPFNVEEMGLFSELGSTTGVANNTTMMLRDLTGTVAVANGQTIIGVYTFTIAV